MNDTELAVWKLAQEQNGQVREEKRYEEACAQVPSGSLNAYDVLRLMQGKIGSREDAGRRARQMVQERGLALMELSDGRYIVAHNVAVPAMADD